jgi:hypothetical protein
MSNDSLLFLVAPILGWLTVWALIIVVHLCRLELIQWRRNRRLAHKRAELGLR